VALPEVQPSLTSKLVVLRPFEIQDVPIIQEASRDPHIPLITSIPTSDDPDEALRYIERQWSRVVEGVGYSFAIADAASNQARGQIGLWPREPRRASIGYWIAPSQRRMGVATAALRTISKWGLRLSELHRLELYVEPWNEGSWRAAERVGYEREGLLRDWQMVGGSWRDMFMYSLLKPKDSDLRPVA
jgi:ribosomal-protein-alanine N-acetyltransferase